MVKGIDTFSAILRLFKKVEANIEFFELGAVSLTRPSLPDDKTILALKFKSSFK